MTGYKAILFAADGDWVTDFKRDTKDEVKEALANRGSRWCFYPFEGVILDKASFTTSSQRVVDMPPPFEHLAGKAIRTVRKYIMAIPENEYEQLFH